MNRCKPLYFIEETIQRIRKQEETYELVTYAGKEYYGNLLCEIVEMDLEFFKSTLEEIDSIILKKKNFISTIKELTWCRNNKAKKDKIAILTGEMQEIFQKQKDILKKIKEKLHPLNELALLELYIKKIAPEIMSYITKKQSDKLMKLAGDNDRNNDIIEGIKASGKKFQSELKDFYKEKQKISVENEYEKDFVTYFGEGNILKHREISLHELIKYYEYVEKYLKTEETLWLQKSFNALEKGSYHMFCNDLLMEKLENYSADKEKENREFTLDIACPLRREDTDREKSCNKIDIVKSTAFFNILSPGEIEKIVKRITLRRYEGQTVMFREGDRPDNVYIIKSGEIALYKEKDKSVELVSLYKGDVFGEMAVITKEKRSLSARIKSQKAELYVITEDNFLSILKTYPSLCVNLSGILCEKIAEATNRLVNYLGDYHSYLKDKDMLERSNKKSDILGAISLFSVLNQKELERICTRIKLKKYEEGRVLFNEGDRAEEVYIIKSGEITLYRIFDRWDERSIITLHKGDILGEMGVLSDSPRSLSGKISSPGAELYTISKDNFLSIINHYHQFSFNLAKILSYRIGDLNRRFFSIK
ncbi:MAG: cyclic nucleotide-binding domain-containing protein [Candidatus Eremiobacterota bacterium]